MGRGKALQALGRTQEAVQAWQAIVDSFGPMDDLDMIELAMYYIRVPELCKKSIQAQEPSPQKPQVITVLSLDSLQRCRTLELVPFNIASFIFLAVIICFSPRH